jgi:hypothetical protein
MHVKRGKRTDYVAAAVDDAAPPATSVHEWLEIKQSSTKIGASSIGACDEHKTEHKRSHTQIRASSLGARWTHVKREKRINQFAAAVDDASLPATSAHG